MILVPFLFTDVFIDYLTISDVRASIFAVFVLLHLGSVSMLDTLVFWKAVGSNVTQMFYFIILVVSL